MVWHCLKYITQLLKKIFCHCSLEIETSRFLKKDTTAGFCEYNWMGFQQDLGVKYVS